MKIDRKFFEKFEDKVKATPEVRERYERGDIKGAEEIVVAALFNKPEDFFNLDKLRKAVQVDRGLPSARSWQRPLARLTVSRPRTNCSKKNWRSSFPSTSRMPPTCRLSGSSSRPT